MTYNTPTNLYETDYVVVSPRVRAMKILTSVAVSDTRLVVGAPVTILTQEKFTFTKKAHPMVAH